MYAHICGNVSFIAKTPRAYLHTDLWVRIVRAYSELDRVAGMGHYRALPNVEDSSRTKNNDK